MKNLYFWKFTPTLRHSILTTLSQNPQSKSTSRDPKRELSSYPLCSRDAPFSYSEDICMRPCRQGLFRDAAWGYAGARDREFAFWGDPWNSYHPILRNSCFDPDQPRSEPPISPVKFRQIMMMLGAFQVLDKFIPREESAIFYSGATTYHKLSSD